MLKAIRGSSSETAFTSGLSGIGLPGSDVIPD
jgi:hypothetical protein